MSNNSHKKHSAEEEKLHREAPDTETFDDVQEAAEEADSQVDEANEMLNKELSDIDALNKQLADAQAQVEKEKKEYLFLMAEFDNFRKRTVKEKSMELIYQKLVKYLEKNGVKAIDSTGKPFDAEMHEAIAMVPVPDDAQKGMVIDTPTKGYTLNDKVLRHAKVVVGQ